ncbi:MAG TPA: hypothetical protein PLX84_15785 [Acidiphilium sp.]|nr:hypothetical protein [Acidiphilium sp.]
MRRKLVLAAPVAALMLAGCAVGPSLAERMSGYVGRPESALVAALGVPDRRITVDGTTYFAYVERSYSAQPGVGAPFPGFYGPYYGPYYGPVFPPATYTRQCTVTFALKGGMVKTFTLRGNDC